jgi:predicted PhzF superfamily epimerase YddE/YHI9
MGFIEVVQGEDMGMPSRLKAEIPAQRGSSVRISGTARVIE